MALSKNYESYTAILTHYNHYRKLEKRILLSSYSVVKIHKMSLI